MSDNLTAFSQKVSKAGLMGFSGTDIKAVIRLPAYKRGSQTFNNEGIFQLGTLQTISISTYNSKTPVKSLGFKAPLAIARGSRTIAGTMIFNQLNTHVFDDESVPLTVSPDKKGLLSYSSGESSYIIRRFENNRVVNGSGPVDREKLKKQWDFSWDNTLIGEISKPADIPPFDIIIVMVNEAGNMAKIILYGVEIVHDSQTLSIEDIYTEAQYQYIARDIEYFRAKDITEAYEWKGGQIMGRTSTEGEVNYLDYPEPYNDPAYDRGISQEVLYGPDEPPFIGPEDPLESNPGPAPLEPDSRILADPPPSPLIRRYYRVRQEIIGRAIG